MEFQTLVLRLRGCTDLPPDCERLRLVPTLAPLSPVLRPLPTVVGVLLRLPLRPVEAPPTRVVLRQLSRS